MLRLTTDKKIDIMDAKNAPSARCKSGDTVLFETLDCYDCSVTRQGERLKIDRMHNPATGPLFVEGAEVGDGADSLQAHAAAYRQPPAPSPSTGRGDRRVDGTLRTGLTYGR